MNNVFYTKHVNGIFLGMDYIRNCRRPQGFFDTNVIKIFIAVFYKLKTGLL